MYEISRDWKKTSEWGAVEKIIDYRYRERIEFSANIGNDIVHETGKRVLSVSSKNVARQLQFAFPAQQKNLLHHNTTLQK